MAKGDVPQIRVLPPVLVGGFLLLGVAFEWLRPIPALPDLVARPLGVAIFVLAGYLAHRAQLALRQVGTNILPTRPTLALATAGPFRRTRNPLYVAALGVYLGVALWVNGVVPLVLLPVLWILLDWGVVRPEERYLAAKFGVEYEAYCARVRRWL